MTTCKKCEVDKPEDQMVVRRGVAIRLCRECLSNARRKKGSGTSKKKATTTRRKRVESPPELVLTLPAGGFGVTSRVTDEGHLQLTQENEGTVADNVCLTRHEAKAIFEKFGDWAEGGAQ